MIWGQMKERLAQILHSPISLRAVTRDQWFQLLKPIGGNPCECKRVKQGQETLFYLQEVDDELLLLVVGNSELTESECSLIELSIESGTNSGSFMNDIKKNVSEDRSAVIQLRNWVLEQIGQDIDNLVVPNSFSLAPLLNEGIIPLLLSTDKHLQGTAPYDAFKKLLKQFFGTEVILIPLEEKEWVVLATKELLNESLEENESIEEQLDAIAMGLHEMLASEWALESHISIYYPIIPSNEIVATVNRLREAITVGRMFSANSNVYLPWKLQLESLLYSVPDERKIKYLQQLLSGSEGILDIEMQTTLGRFFELDCNVSETAKQLFIHRNTLLYRFDKFKQETGLDVRSFRDAMRVKLALELYNVTKSRR